MEENLNYQKQTKAFIAIAVIKKTGNKAINAKKLRIKSNILFTRLYIHKKLLFLSIINNPPLNIKGYSKMSKRWSVKL